MDDIMQRAQADREMLEAKVRRLSADLEHARNDLTKVSAFLELYERYASDRVGALTQAFAVSFRDRGIKAGTKGAILESAAVVAIERHGRALSIQTLVSELTAQGVEIGGERPATNLAGVLSRSSRVHFTQGIGWEISPSSQGELRPEGAMASLGHTEPSEDAGKALQEIMDE